MWGLFNQNIGLNQLRDSTRVMCFAAKWQGQKGIEFYSEHHHGRQEMVEQAHRLLTEADVVAHYNGKRFDIPHLNREFVIAGMMPPAPYQQLDFLEVVKRRFRMASNKLEWVSQALGIGAKVKHQGHEMWTLCLAGDPKAWREMEKYNKQDVALLEELHRVLLPWITTHPNRRLYGDGEGCPNCGSADLRREGFAYTQVGRFQRYQCRACGTWSREGKRHDGTDIRGAAA
ncbi:ribonuclease H-like domain-containing protein [Dactylosporangium sp. CA-139066]|uniref:ribonuclease H-like domain-containing protein n=1 Tax=Dactylosporangium sp. CA-139066 TaxID=3239930 RepID=UPI003D89C9B7